MKKKSVLLISAGILSLTAIGSALFGSVGKVVGAEEAADAEIWNHYSTTKAGERGYGNKEYWVSCLTHEHTFTKPSTGKIVEMGKPNDAFFKTLSDTDNRYLGNVEDPLTSEGSAWRYFRHGGWGASDFTNRKMTITTNFTMNGNVIADAKELGYKYVYFHVDAVLKETSTVTLRSMVFESRNGGKLSGDNTWIQTNGASNGFTIPVDNFVPLLDYNHLDDTVFFNLELRNTNNEKIEGSDLEHVTVKNFRVFKDEETLDAYKNLDTVASGDGWRYFRYAFAPESGDKTGYSLRFGTGSAANFTITKNLIADAKEAGCNKFSFLIKAESSDGADIIHMVHTSDGLGAWNADYAEGDVDKTTGYYRMTLDCSKFFDVVTKASDDVAYNVQGRLAGAAGRYEGAKETLIHFTLADFLLL